MFQELNLTVQVAADEWAYAQRRLTYLETLLLSVVRDRANIQEWYEAAELAALRLPGLPHDKATLTRKATMARWKVRRVGKHRLFHVTSLPSRAFDALIARILDLPEMEMEVPALPGLPPMPEPSALSSPNTAPPWVLPLMRLMRGEARGDLGRAWRDLPQHLPRGTILPAPDEAATILVELGLFEKIANWSEH